VKASEIAALVEGSLEGDTDPEITGVSPLDRAGYNELSFLANGRYLPYFRNSGAGAVLLTGAHASEPGYGGARIVVRDVHRALAALLPRLYPQAEPEPGIHPTAVLGEGVVLGAGVSIGPYAVIGREVRLGAGVQIGAHVVIGDGCELADGVVLHPQATLYPGVRIGERSIIHSGTRLGVDGFGYVFVEGSHRKVPQVGSCSIGADVEIGANTTIDRGSIGFTEIGDNVKIDNMVHIGHNVRIGDRSVIVAQVGIAGSTVIGSGVTLGGQVGVAGHITIGDGVTVAAQAGVFGDLPSGREVYSGYPARPHRESLRAQAGIFRLPRLIRRIQALEQAIFGRGTPEE
jgi:UDP-3-O-[3-hydroxymyristoyl] glucosamine N-acyltransferase